MGSLPDWAIIIGSIVVVLVIPLIIYIFSMSLRSVWRRFQTHKEDIDKVHKIANEAHDMSLTHDEQIKTLYNITDKQATKDQVDNLEKLIDVRLTSTNRLLESYNATVEGARNELVTKHLDREKRATLLAEKVVDQNTELIRKVKE